ncbi:MAG: hypothetical protein A6D91_03990 [Bacillaceae bacterium G1]|mgnify:CR=1 FL=1|nr:lytic transglycosylase [Bacillota bacterium]OJF17268.1 MAG: hypothetical protein A6D91_03990 [Bacillaceae bacterium G1]
MRVVKNKRFWVAVALLAGLLLVYSATYQRLAFPMHYRDEIWQAAAKYDVSPYLVAAIIQSESRYNKDARSKKGALGLMQLMPETAKWALLQMGYSEAAEEFLHDPSLNIEVGTWYLRWLLDYYQGNWPLAIAAYNAGQGVVDRWLREGQWDGRADTVDQIPYPETRRYVRKVLYYYQKYRHIYRDASVTPDYSAKPVDGEKVGLQYTVKGENVLY